MSGFVRGEVRALRDEVLATLAQEQFFDIRSPEEYRGERLAPEHLPEEQAQVPGHIPGAVNIPWSRAASDARRVIRPRTPGPGPRPGVPIAHGQHCGPVGLAFIAARIVGDG